MDISACSDVGKVRRVNEDNYYVSKFKKDIGFVIVADGMGGHKGGKTASSLAIKTMAEMFEGLFDIKKEKNYTDEEIKEIIKKCISHSNKEIYKESLLDDSLRGMGTTMVFCLSLCDRIVVANVGDSRLYLIQDKTIKQVTKDHSMVQQLYDLGEITLDEAENHPSKNIITRAIGSEPDVLVDFYVEKIKKGDYIVLCSDGLTNLVSEKEILSTIVQSPNDASKILIDKANKKGGFDNITIIILKV